MPRLKSKSREYKISDAHRYIKRHLKMDGVRQADIGAEIGITQRGFGQRIQNNNLHLGDVLTIIEMGDWTDEEIICLMRAGGKR